MKTSNSLDNHHGGHHENIFNILMMGTFITASTYIYCLFETHQDMYSIVALSLLLCIFLAYVIEGKKHNGMSLLFIIMAMTHTTIRAYTQHSVMSYLIIHFTPVCSLLLSGFSNTVGMLLGYLILHVYVVVLDGAEYYLQCDVPFVALFGVIYFCHQSVTMSNFQNTTSLSDQINRTDKAVHESKAKTNNIAAISHDIRNPINGIAGFSDILLTTSLNSQQSEYIEDIRANCKLLTCIINDVLDISKIESNTLVMVNNPMSIMEAIECSVKMLYSEAEGKKLELMCYIDPRIPLEVFADRAKLDRVFINLMNNAIRYTNTGNIQLTAILQEDRDDCVSVRFSCLDTGIGIPSDALNSNLFSAYYQIKNDTNDTVSYKGIGIGLSICDNFVAHMNSKLHVKSTIGVGTEFYFDILLPKLSQKKTIIDIVPNKQHDVVVVIGQRENKALSQLIYSYTQCMRLKNTYLLDSWTDLEAHVLTHEASSGTGFQHFVIFTQRSDYEASKLLLAKQLYKCILIQSEFESRYTKYEERLVILRKPVMFLALVKAMDGSRVGVVSPTPHARILLDQVRVNFQNKDIQILVVEDNLTNQRVLVRMLQSVGITKIDTACNGFEGLNLLCERDVPYTCVFSDMQMPVMDGVEFCKSVRAIRHVYKSEIPIVILTGNAFDTAVLECFNAGATSVLSKPISLDLIIGELRKIIQLV
jgi:two-component system sensor histidine kinase/response regulator